MDFILDMIMIWTVYCKHIYCIVGYEMPLGAHPRDIKRVAYVTIGCDFSIVSKLQRDYVVGTDSRWVLEPQSSGCKLRPKSPRGRYPIKSSVPSLAVTRLGGHDRTLDCFSINDDVSIAKKTTCRRGILLQIKMVDVGTRHSAVAQVYLFQDPLSV